MRLGEQIADVFQYITFMWAKTITRGVVQLDMVKIVLSSHFHKKVRATIGFVPTSQLPWWFYRENERTIWEQMA